MTDPVSLNTHTAPLPRSTPGSIPSPFKTALSQNKPTAIAGEEVEDYTIKCICGFEDDDGNTVFCDTCETWQHTECYYIDDHGKVPTRDDLESIDHFCKDCKPRLLDAKGAIERQRNRRKELDPSDRRVKKTTSKSHKKKIRAPESNASLTNGWTNGDESDLFHDRTSRSPRDPHALGKRVKMNHRSSHSMHSSLPNAHPHKRSGPSMHSPSKKQMPNGCAKDSYSAEFLSLYDNDPGDRPMQANIFNDINVTQNLSLWRDDVEELSEATKGLSHPDVFNRCGQPIDSIPLPQLSKEHKEDESAVTHGRHPRWTYLTIESDTPKDSIIGELKGKIGHMNDYIEDPANRWDYLRHPAPFVFFHPKLPIYIDTRSEGTICRYLRRSCEPNLSMKTFLENEQDYHFCFVAKRDLRAGAELTIGWVLDEHIRKHFSYRNHEDVKMEGESDDDYVSDWVGKVLAQFGGCACNSPDTCALAKWDRRGTSNQGRNGYSGKYSPLENGYTTNSRASSEQADKQSSSGSKSQSRDLTPTRDTPGDLGFGTGLELSDREKRKIAALEKNFEQLENDKYQPAQKKKKRNSGGTAVNTPAAGASKQLDHTATSFSQSNTPRLSLKSQYIDASTSGRKSGSPMAKSSNPLGRPRSNTATNTKKRSSQQNTPSVPSPLVRHNYVSSAMQTEPDEEDNWYKPPPAPFAKKPYMSLTKRLLIRSQQDHAKLEERRRISLGTSDGTQPNDQHLAIAENVDSSPAHQDTETQDAGSGQSSTSIPMSFLEHLVPNPRPPDDDVNAADIKTPPPLPSVEHFRPLNGFRQNNLHVQMPAKPNMASDLTSVSPLIETPTSAVLQSPFAQHPASYPPAFLQPSSSLVQPSPIKKKVSLGEYFQRLKESQPATEMTATSSPPMQQGAFKPTGDCKDVSIHGSATVDTPKKEETDILATEKSKDPKL